MDRAEFCRVTGGLNGSLSLTNQLIGYETIKTHNTRDGSERDLIMGMVGVKVI